EQVDPLSYRHRICNFTTSVVYRNFFVMSTLFYLLLHFSSALFAFTELEATPRFELGNKGFADLCLTTWLCRLITGAEDEIRTRDPRLGKAMLYH
ncbi:MAG: hypothetical protein H6Q73_1646, partial [Firmicutes bacterium]|nr:hypothetical protein [Bacillota bacterium]